MKNTIRLILTAALLVGAAVSFTACNSDDEPVNVEVAFVEPTLPVAEGDQNVVAQVVLDKPAPEDIIVEYSLSGTATRKVGSISTGDYELSGTLGRIEIDKGETSGNITFNILTDAVFEGEEKIVITLNETSIPNATIGDQDQMEIIIGGNSVTVSFASATALTVNEAAPGVHEITVNITPAVNAPLTVDYDLSPGLTATGQLAEGIALDSLTGFQEEVPRTYWDYFIDGESGKVTFAPGQTSAVIRVNVESDMVFDPNERIELTLKPATGVVVGTNSKATINIVQEKGRIILLTWGETLNVDMDLFCWLKFPDGEYDVVQASNFDGTDGIEFVLLPDWFMALAQEELELLTLEFANSYVYYSGAAQSLPFTVTYIDILDNGSLEATAARNIYNATYTAANINTYTNDISTLKLVQTFTFTNGAHTTPSAISVPTAGSRIRTAIIPQNTLEKKIQRRWQFLHKPL